MREGGQKLRLEQTEPSDGVSNRSSMLKNLVSALALAVDALDGHSETDRIGLGPIVFDHAIDFYDEVRDFEIALIVRALKVAGGSQVRAAELLALNTTTLNAKIKHYNIPWRRIA